jgi:hypothetical protein
MDLHRRNFVIVENYKNYNSKIKLWNKMMILFILNNIYNLYNIKFKSII